MFKISTKGDYGLLLLSTLAEKDKGEFVSLKEIIIPLKNAGIVESREGLRGGYRLTKKPHEINIMNILEILEGQFSPVRCCTSEREDGQNETCGSCQSEEVCNVKHLWRDASSLMTTFLRNKTLADTVISPSAKTPNVTFIK